MFPLLRRLAFRHARIGKIEPDSVFLQNVHRESKLTSRLSRTKRLKTLFRVSSELLKFFFPQQILPP